MIRTDQKTHLRNKWQYQNIACSQSLVKAFQNIIPENDSYSNALTCRNQFLFNLVYFRIHFRILSMLSNYELPCDLPYDSVTKELRNYISVRDSYSSHPDEIQESIKNLAVLPDSGTE